MKTTWLTFGLVLLLSTAGCDDKEQCVADCNGETGSESGSETGNEPAPQCVDANDAATEFIEANRACETLLDCKYADALCYSGDAPSPCGTVALAVTADDDAWNALHGDIEGACECLGAPDCGPGLLCNEAGQCEAHFGDVERYCDSVQGDIETFLDANRACEVDTDCVGVESTCHVDECSVVALNTSASVEDWTQLDTLLAECGPAAYCNYVGECGPEIRCSDAGRCEAVF